MKPEMFQNISNVLILIGVILTALGGYGSYHFGKKNDKIREDTTAKQTVNFNEKIDSLIKGNQELKQGNKELNQQLLPFIAYARSLYPNDSDSTALEKLRKDIDDTKKELNLEKNTLNNLSSILKVKFSGNWRTQPYHPLLSPVNDLYFLLFENEQKTEQRIEFFATEAFNYTKIDDRTAIFESRQAVKNGSFPLGKLIQFLDRYDKINFFIPFIEFSNFQDPFITIEQFEISLVINGKIVKHFRHDGKFKCEVKYYNNNKALAWASVPYRMKNNILADFE
jgi:hypothetical protein